MSDHSAQPMSLMIPCSLEGIAAWESEIEHFVAELSPDDQQVYLISLSIVEVLTNIVEHGFAGSRSKDSRIQIALSGTDEAIEVTVTDNASAPPTGTVDKLHTRSGTMPSLETSLEELPVSGWGLNIIASVASSIHYERLVGGNLLRLVFPTLSADEVLVRATSQAR